MENLSAQVIKPATLADYQDGSIISRVLLKQEQGNVTFFAFDQGQEPSEHRAPFDALVQVLEGRAELVIAGHAHQLQAGEMIIMPADQHHALKAPERFKMLLTMIRD